MRSLDDTLASLSAAQRQILHQWLNALEPQQSSTTGRRQIRAFVVAADRHTTLHDIKPFLAGRLPHFMLPDRIDFVDSLPRLPNGKLDRSALRLESDATRETESSSADGFLEPRSEAERILAQIWSESLQVEPIGVHDNFFELGGDSIISIQVVSKARDRGLDLSHSDFQNNATIAGMAATLRESAPSDPSSSNTERRDGEGRLTPIQHWFLQRGLSKPAHWNSARVFELPPDFSGELVRAAVRACVEHHEGLRARFPHKATGGLSRQLVEDLDDADIFHRLPESSDSNQISQSLTAIQDRFTLADGPLLAVAYWPGNQTGPARLYVIAHHLLLDNVSWNILTEDLGTALTALRDSRPVTLPPQTTSILDWSDSAAGLADSAQCVASLENWQNTATSVRIPVDYPLTTWPLERSVKAVQTTLNKKLTDRLNSDAMKAYNTQVRDLLIAALALTLADWTGHQTVQFDLEGHGRDALDSRVDIARTVGWFTSFFPHCLTIPVGSDAGETIKTAKESLRQLPGNGIYFGMLRYLSSSEAIRRSLESVQTSQILFNYLGRAALPASASVLKPLGVDQLELRAAGNSRSHLIEVNTEISEECLVSTWLYSDEVHRPATIETLATKFSEHLEALVDHCLTSEAGGYTVSDFPEAALDQDDLDSLLDSLAPDSGK